MKFWIARNERGFLFLYDDEPFINEYGCWETFGNCYSIDDRLFPEVTLKNSPQEVKLKLLKQL